MSASVPVRFQEFYLLGVRKAGVQFVEEWVSDVEAGDPDPYDDSLRAPLTFSFSPDSERALKVPQRLAQALAVACSTAELTFVAVPFADVVLSRVMASS